MKSIFSKFSKLNKVQKDMVVICLALVVLGIYLLPGAMASPVPVRSVTITSEKLNYSKKEPGSFNIEKQAEWISLGKTRITFDLDTVMKTEKKDTDIILVLDVSSSMNGEKLDRVKQDSIELLEALLSNKNNKASLITFETNSKIVSDFTSDKQSLIDEINNLTTGSMTNYYQALVNVDRILKNYKYEKDKDCIVLFLTDGYPNENTPNEIGEYKYLKEEYPYLVINAVQYEMGSDVLDPIIKISDQQFIADMTNLNNVLFEASVAPISYDSFQIVDYIDNRYFEVDSIDSIYSTLGDVKLEYEDGIPKVTWNIDNLRSGRSARLEIEVSLKKEYLDKEGLYPTNIKEEIKSEIDDTKEDITSNKTPILASHYQVIYDANIPGDCTLTSSVPLEENKKVFETVEISDKKLTCGNYQFKGWKIVTSNVRMINDDYFIMSESDVVLKAEWGITSIDKSMDGEVYTVPPSIIKKISRNQNTDIWKYKFLIEKIVFENSIHDVDNSIETFDISEENNETVIAHVVPNGNNSSTYTVYIQGNDKVIANEDSSSFLFGFMMLKTLEGLENFDTSQVTNMSSMFYECRNLTNLDLSNFDTSQVTNMSSMFNNCSSLTSLDLSNFDTSQVTNMSVIFQGCSKLTSLDLSNFDTSQVTDMSSMFNNCSSLTSLDLSNFDTSQVTDMSSMFNNCSSLTSLDLSNFDTSQVTTMSSMFSSCRSLTSLDLSSFDKNQVTDMSRMFYNCMSLTSLDLSNFDTSQVTNMYRMFFYCNSLTSLDLSNFNTSQVTNMSDMFISCRSLTSLDLSNFDTSQVTNMSYMFDDCSSLTSLDLSNFDTSQVTNMISMFRYCSSLTTTITIMTTKTTSYSYMFPSAASNNGAQITVNYTSETSDLVDEMIATKSSDSNVVKGNLVV